MVNLPFMAPTQSAPSRSASEPAEPSKSTNAPKSENRAFSEVMQRENRKSDASAGEAEPRIDAQEDAEGRANSVDAPHRDDESSASVPDHKVSMSAEGLKDTGEVQLRTDLGEKTAPPSQNTDEAASAIQLGQHLSLSDVDGVDTGNIEGKSNELTRATPSQIADTELLNAKRSQQPLPDAGRPGTEIARAVAKHDGLQQLPTAGLSDTNRGQPLIETRETGSGSKPEQSTTWQDVGSPRVAESKAQSELSRPGVQQKAELTKTSTKPSILEQVTLAKQEGKTLDDFRTADRHGHSANAQAVQTHVASPTNQSTSTAQAPVVAAYMTSQSAQWRNAGSQKVELADRSLVLDGDFSTHMVEARGTAATHQPSPLSQLTAPQQSAMARHVAGQIHDALRIAGDKAVEISLNPAELGRIRMSVSASEGGVTLHILAERPETLDLMKRNLDSLSKSLTDLGFDTMDLSFGHGKQADQNAQSEDAASTNGLLQEDDMTEILPLQSATAIHLDGSRGVDIRI